jgi:hypothetical protein
MIGLMPEELIQAALQLACCGLAAFTAVMTFLFAPRC